MLCACIESTFVAYKRHRNHRVRTSNSIFNLFTDKFSTGIANTNFIRYNYDDIASVRVKPKLHHENDKEYNGIFSCHCLLIYRILYSVCF